MKAVSKRAAVVFQAAIDRIPEGETSVCLDARDQAHGGSIMALHVEQIGENKNGKLYSFAHYYELAGDLMRDPDVVMLHTKPLSEFGYAILRNDAFYPLSYRQDGLGIDREYVMFNEDGSGWRINKKEQADLCSFCGTWARNLKEQQGLVPVKRSNGLENMTADEGRRVAREIVAEAAAIV